ncbi:tRNA threonylcarbamoyladenosine biosynthesis protein TsaE [Sulfitobacter marinus]|uniref:tRNA threonylcarbamoyladenosine biosynthesis protein TsaE n=1 Tax=Sulfitobacter marinus TaxID=394264 RepID=A0A1I6T451_9RHOB|nr:tRNA (adenosine(37)-N6)-threonylcarbamoyltransferase complex ATPase subunit type 1 TsaE [Sulfitobacter marinus]SFS84049.1 tRNA threonylcarbamoyladenosine biosynthesis protein TsaE [Sulfitobacter marinus]
MSDHSLSLDLHNAEETSQAARALGAGLTAGDTILLTGDVGAGKTHFARSLIQSLLTTPEDVPSPTFTLVQTYDTSAGTIWHADLYRLTSTFEIEELGLSDAFQDAICLVEWPDRLGDLKPKDALEIALETTGDDSRILTASWDGDKWGPKLKSWRR